MKRSREELDPVLLRRKMVEREVVGKGVTEPRVVEAMGAVPRHLFVDEALAARAYEGQPLPIGHRQTISRPHTVALMSELLEVGPSQRVLEIGTGSGYQAAVLSRLARHVDSVERHAALARRARRILADVGIRNVVVWQRDGSLGLPGQPPYPRIIVTCGSPELPLALLQQLEDGGRLVVPVADNGGGEILHVVSKVNGSHRVDRSVPCSFVPLIGRHGYGEPPTPPLD
jgi:protein-L-isoaspartate(D-aspartate) O-methyltransferase